LGLGFTQGIPEDLDGAGAPVERASIDELQRHFARELHDEVAQPLIDLVLEIRELKTAQDEMAELKGELARLEEVARKVLRQTRALMIDLRERSELRVNFPLALKNDLGDGQELNLQVTSRWPRKINGWAAFHLLRIVKQAIANARRHGHAEKIDVFLDLGPADDAVIVVLDDGIGIDDAPGGFGVLGMQERAAILGGTLSARPRETGGTRIEVRVPVESLA
jgi:two-component system sensor histidine kinase UhpB